MDITNIIASLKYGKVFNRRSTILLYFLLVLSIILIAWVFTVILLIVFVQELNWNNETTIMVIGGSLLGLLLGGIALLFILKNNMHKKEIVLCLNDAIAIKALVKRLDIVSLEYKPYQVQFEFDIDGEKHFKISYPGNVFTGYHKIFAKYDNKTIKILYSPTYDEVLILKDKK